MGRDEDTWQLTLTGPVQEVCRSLPEAMACLRPYIAQQKYAGDPVLAFGPKRCFDDVRTAATKEYEDAYDAEYQRGREGYDKWMSNFGTWGDYFEAKDMRTEFFNKFDFQQTWLRYGGVAGQSK